MVILYVIFHELFKEHLQVYDSVKHMIALQFIKIRFMSFKVDIHCVVNALHVIDIT